MKQASGKFNKVTLGNEITVEEDPNYGTTEKKILDNELLKVKEHLLKIGFLPSFIQEFNIGRSHSDKNPERLFIRYGDSNNWFDWVDRLGEWKNPKWFSGVIRSVTYPEKELVCRYIHENPDPQLLIKRIGKPGEIYIYDTKKKINVGKLSDLEASPQTLL